MVHNEMVLDDNDVFECVGVNHGDVVPYPHDKNSKSVGVVRGDVIGLVNLRRLARPVH